VKLKWFLRIRDFSELVGTYRDKKLRENRKQDFDILERFESDFFSFSRVGRTTRKGERLILGQQSLAPRSCYVHSLIQNTLSISVPIILFPLPISTIYLLY
jgi:hypothetical protein